MSHWTTTTARTMIYFCCIGGLLVLNSLVVVVLWNQVFRVSGSSSPELSFLEGAGITAFAYVIIFSIKYGVQSAAARASQPQRTPSERFAHLTPEQRSALKTELVQSCGCKETDSKC